ncbi:PilT/PilU family type 4a pilus ATPase [Lachnospiraceae bacterium ZAX-1]
MKTIEEIMTIAAKKGSSDVHLAPGTPIMYRINGVLEAEEGQLVSKEDMQELVGAILDEKQKKGLQKYGEIDFAYSIGEFGRNRVNVYRQRGTYAVALRMLSRQAPSPEELGLPQSAINLIEKKRGLIIVTGAAGSGKSTTIASLVGKIAQTYVKNIITLEDPIEYLHPYKKSMVTQREISYDALTYAQALRAALKQDPDVIVVGEMTDLETMSTVLNAAEAGHLVFSSLHTSNTIEAIDRMIDVFPTHQKEQVRVQLSNVLEGVVAQQFLVREDSGSRIAAFEVMLANTSIRNRIREGKTEYILDIMQENKEKGMQTMDNAIFDLYMKSHITAGTAVAYALDQNSMGKKVTLL